MDPKKLKAWTKDEGGFPPEEEEEEAEETEEGEETEDEEGEEIEEDETPALDDEELDEIDEQIEAGDGDPELMGLLNGYDPETMGNPPQWVADEATWEKAKEAVDPEGKGAKYNQPYAVIAHLYQQLGGTLKKKSGKK